MTVLKLTIPDEKDLYFVGDIHGQHDLYARSLREFGITNDDVVISVGDLIDRGPKTAKTLFEFLFQDNRYAVMGNHEQMCLQGAHAKDWFNMWYNNGGKEFTDEVGNAGIQYFRQYLSKLPLVIEVQHRGKKFGVVHGSVPLKYTNWDDVINIAENPTNEFYDEFMWSNDTFQYCKKNYVPIAPRISGVDYVFSGHTSVVDPLVYGNRIWIDSMFLSGELTFSYLDGNIIRHLRKERDSKSFVKPGFK